MAGRASHRNTAQDGIASSATANPVTRSSAPAEAGDGRPRARSGRNRPSRVKPACLLAALIATGSWAIVSAQQPTAPQPAAPPAAPSPQPAAPPQTPPPPAEPGQAPPAAPRELPPPDPAAGTAAAQPAPAPQRPTYRTGVDLVALNVIVLDPQERLIGGLNREEFAVYEDGVRQELQYFETSSVPLDLALLIDTSASMDNKLAFVRKAAAGFARTLRPGDRGAVITFNGRVNVQQGFTSDIGAITQAIERTSPSGGTALYNAVYVTLKEFARASKSGDGGVRRQAMVVLSDGEDTASLLSFDELLEEARRGGVTTYTIGLKEDGLIYTTAARERRYFSQADFCLKTLARETGALAYFPDREQDLVAAYRAIGDELSQQYALGYVSKNQIKNGAYRRVVVRIVDRPDARPRTRTGYTAIPERTPTTGSQQD